MTNDLIERLEWHVQYAHRNPKRDGTDLTHYAKSSVGTFEIYETGEFGETDYLLNFPGALGMPSEMFKA